MKTYLVRRKEIDESYGIHGNAGFSKEYESTKMQGPKQYCNILVCYTFIVNPL